MKNENVTTQASASEAERTRNGRTYVPDVDITETDASIVVRADMPGVAPDRLSITLENNVLTIEGSAVLPGMDKHTLAYAEFGTGDFRRVFSISDEIDRNGITASMKNGVMNLVLPKAKEVQPRKIAVQAA